jgi:AraC-like DNA-binding protein
MISTLASIEAETPLTAGIPTIRPLETCNGFSVTRYNHQSMFTQGRTLAHHTIQFNFGDPVFLSWKSNEKTTSEICSTGNLVALLSKGEVEELQWVGEFNMLEISYDASFIDTLLEKESFTFREVYNVYDPLLRDIVVSFHDNIYADCLHEKLYAESLAVACAIHVGTNYAVGDKKIFAPKGKLSSYQLKNIIDYVRSGIHKVITLEELAALAHLSVFHFSRLFKNTVGVSPYQFVLRMKIEYAKKFIKRKEPIGDIAYRLGFTDSAHFCNTFKKFTGQAPLQSNIITDY